MNERDAIEELSYIKEIMQDSRKAFVYNGFDYIFWGILIVLGLLSTYLAVIYHLDVNTTYIWIVLIAIGWSVSIILSVKEKKKRKASTFAGKIIGGVWFSAGVAMTLIGFVGTLSGAINGVFVSPIISLILGMAFYITGTIYGSKLISLTSIGWWGGAILMFYLPGMPSLLIMAFMMIAFQIVPGIALYNQAKKEVAE